MLITQIKELETQIGDIEKEQIKLENAERRLSTKIESFKTRKEMIKAQYSAAEAQVKIKENVTGISEEMNDLGMVLTRVEEKTENMKAKASALDEMMDSGVLTDVTQSYSSGSTDIDQELDKVSLDSSVDEELTKLKTQIGKT
jgi:phage shock protein A